MRAFAATLCWGCLAALVAVFAALLSIPSLDQSLRGSWAIFFLAFCLGSYIAAVHGEHELPDKDLPDSITWSFRRLVMLRLAVIWTLGYFGASILGRSRGALAVFLPIDGWIKFSPVWTPIYLIAFPMILLSLLLVNRRRDLEELASAYTITILISAIIFVLHPMEVPRPHLMTEMSFSGWALQTLYRFDSTRNALPSLHAGLGLCCCRLSFRISNSIGILFCVLLLGFLTATLATRQHAILDLLTGLTLGSVALVMAGRIMDRKFPRAAVCPDS